MGFYVIALDGDAHSPGLALADESRVVDIADAANCLQVAQEFHVDGVLSICTEVAVCPVATIADAMGLPGISPDAALGATNKLVMRRRFEEAGVPGPRFRRVASAEEAVQVAEEWGCPLVIKPADNAGSRGVRRVDRPEALAEAYALAAGSSRSGQVIIEEFMVGVESTVECLCSEGQVEVLAISDKKHVPFPECVAICLTYPPHFSADVQDEIRQVVRAATKAVSVDSGPVHAEVMVTSTGVKMVELAARGGGFRVFSDIVPLVSGVDIVKETVKMAMGVPADIKARYAHAAVLRFFNPQQRGKLIAVHGVEDARAVAGIQDVVIEAVPGDVLGPIAGDRERPGYIISSAETREQAVRQADEAESLVRFEVEGCST